MLPPRSLRALTWSFSALFLGATAVTGALTYTTTRSTILTLIDKRIADVTEEILDHVDPSDRGEIVRRIDENMKERDTADLGFLLEDARGLRLAGNVSPKHRLPLGYSTIGDEEGIAGLSEGRALVRRFGDLRLTTLSRTEPFDNYDATRARTYFVGFGSIVLIVFGGVFSFGLLVGRRVETVRRTAEAIVDGDLGRRVPTAGTSDAFDELAEAFNHMLDRVTALMSTISNISNDVAHDLRTPLARLRGTLERIWAKAETPERAAEAEEAIAQCDALLEMFAAILRIAEIEGGDRRAGFVPLDLADLAQDVGEMMAPVAEEGDRALGIGPLAPAPILGDRQLLSQMMLNLIENALRHTPAGTHVQLQVVRGPSTVRLIVCDDGPGIPAEEHQRALRRFGRIDRSRNRPGHGLGLPLIEVIARLHRGDLQLGDARPGLAATVTLPLAEGVSA